ncbi:MAG: ankyrin repeat domain-containing protein [Acidobacteria bacterium]|nr:ankyrin repeat domain-containing protein [Acidobacteriota bacterium]
MEPFLAACSSGDLDAIRTLAASHPALLGSGLHAAAFHGQLAAVRLLLELGADPNTRDTGDNAYPLHFAAGLGHLEIVRALLDAGGDVHGFGDVHEGGVIGWAAAPTHPAQARMDVIQLLLDRGAKHHIFSAIGVGDLTLIRGVVEQNPDALKRRMSRFEQGQSPLHLAVNNKRYDILDLLIELGAGLEAVDKTGQTALTVALFRGDKEAARRLEAAGAKPPELPDATDFSVQMNKLAGSVFKCTPMIAVPDVGATLAWYTSIGFSELGRYEDGGVPNWGMLAFGKAQFMLVPNGKTGRQSTSLWFYTNQIEALYRICKAHQLRGAEPPIEFVEEIYDPFYGGREFGIRDLNGYKLFFQQDMSD